MSTLHMLSHSPFSDSRLSNCLPLLAPGDGLLLCGDAVYALLPGSTQRQALERLPENIALLALEEDLQARAIDTLPVRTQRLDYPAVVDATLAYGRVNSWL
jgi:tRNA 2-thiouridine synthesizing protein B